MCCFQRRLNEGDSYVLCVAVTDLWNVVINCIQREKESQLITAIVLSLLPVSPRYRQMRGSAMLACGSGLSQPCFQP